MTTIKTDIEFGKFYQDKITGFKGAAVGIVKHQFGCLRINLQPKINEDGTVPDSLWFDEESICDVIPQKITKGGFMPAPKRRQDPVKQNI